MPISRELAPGYPKDWGLRRRFILEHRSRGRCEWCGAADREPHPVTGSEVVLTLTQVWDRDAEKLSLLNLAGLCQRCHNRWNARDRLARRVRKRIVGLLLAGQMPLPLAPEESLAMALYQRLLQTGQISGSLIYQWPIPASAYEWVDAGWQRA